MSLPKAEELFVVEFGRKTYLGVVEENTIVGIVMHGDVGKDDVERYICTVNLGDEIHATHRKGNYVERPLTEDEAMLYTQTVQVFERVSSKALKIVENDLFKQALQK